jgi:hypothetical protein
VNSFVRVTVKYLCNKLLFIKEWSLMLTNVQLNKIDKKIWLIKIKKKEAKALAKMRLKARLIDFTKTHFIGNRLERR